MKLIQLREIGVVYTPGRIDKLAGLSYDALDRIEYRLDQRAIQATAGAVVWGQYLDDRRYSETQWVLLGTCAAVQAISVRARSGGTAGVNHLIQGGLKAIPRDHTAPPAVITSKVAQPKPTSTASFASRSLRPRSIPAMPRSRFSRDHHWWLMWSRLPTTVSDGSRCLAFLATKSRTGMSS